MKEWHNKVRAIIKDYEYSKTESLKVHLLHFYKDETRVSGWKLSEFYIYFFNVNLSILRICQFYSFIEGSFYNKWPISFFETGLERNS